MPRHYQLIDAHLILEEFVLQSLLSGIGSSSLEAHLVILKEQKSKHLCTSMQDMTEELTL